MSTHFGFKTLDGKRVRLHFEEGIVQGTLRMDGEWRSRAKVQIEGECADIELGMEPGGYIYVCDSEGRAQGPNIPVTVIS